MIDHIRPQATDQMGSQVLSRIRALAGIQESEEGYVLHCSPGSLCLGLSHLVAAALLLLLFGMVVWSLVKFPYFSPVGLVEEAAYTYTSANNFVRYGFLNSGFLQDFSNSSDPADHPYVYNHMPPGPDIFTGLVLRASSGSYRLLRLIYALIFLAGIVFYLKFVQLVLSGFGLKGASYAVLFLGPSMLIQNMERQPYSPFPLLAFAPLIALHAYYRTGRRVYLALVLVTGFVSAVYLEYILLAGLIWFWVFLYLTQLIRVDRRHLVAFLGVVGLGIGLHLLQNFVYLGPSLFFRELGITLGNRIVGSPSQDEVKEFYRSIGLVHHGSHAPDLSVLALQFWMLFWFPGRKFLALAAAISLGWVVWRCARYDRAQGVVILRRGEGTVALAYFGKLALCIGATLTIPLVMFPAFSQEVTLFGSRANLYLLAIGTIALLGFSLRQIVQYRPRFGRIARADITPRWLLSRWRWLLSAALWVGLLIGVGLSVTGVLKTNLEELRQVFSAFREFRYIQLADLQRFSGHLYMTNINTPTVGFWVKKAGYGVCGLESLPESGDVDPSKCKVALMRRTAYYATQRPRYFFFFAFPSLFPGFADCLPSGMLLGQKRGGNECVALMHDRRLSNRFLRAFQNDLFEVYDLDAPRNEMNLALRGTTRQSSTARNGSADRAVDGDMNGDAAFNSVTHTENELHPWWEVDLGAVRAISGVDVWNRTDCCWDRLKAFYVFVSEEPFTSTNPVATRRQAGVSTYYVPSQAGRPTTIAVNRKGRFVRVQLSGANYLSLAEVQVWGSVDAPLTAK